MLPDKENLQLHATTAHNELLKVWKDYQKPTDAHSLKTKFSLESLRCAASVDQELKLLLNIIGLIK